VFRSEYWYRFPWLVMLPALGLVALGIAGIYSATAGGEEASFWETPAAKQLAFLGVALVVFGAALLPGYTRLARWSYWFFALTLALLVLLAVLRVLNLKIPGFIYPTNNAYSWICIPGSDQKVQPSELAKIAFIMSLAFYLRYRKNYRRFWGLLVPFAMALVPTALVLYQPDLGTAMLFLPVLFLMLFAAGARAKHLAAIIALGLLCVPAFYASMHGYQRMRIDSWLLHGCAERLHFAIADAEHAARREARDANGQIVAAAAARLADDEKTALVREVTGMWRFRAWRLATHLVWKEDPSDFAAARDHLFVALREEGTGPRSFNALRQFFATLLAGPSHQLFQAKIAVGAGGFWGRGWLEGTQTRHGLLPFAETDFIFPVVAEQFGYVGAAAVVILYGLVCLMGMDVSFSTTEPFGKLLVVGVVGLVAAQAFLNLAMSIGLAPVTGITLPLVSYGGSSLTSSFLALGLLCNVALRRLYLIAPRPFEWQE